jgi:hypothetical protein
VEDFVRSVPGSAIVGPMLRDYPHFDIEKIRGRYRSGAGRVLYQAPTGLGLFAHIVVGTARRGNRFVGLGHWQEIVDQICANRCVRRVHPRGEH